MKKRIVSVFLCIALTMIPALSLSATESEMNVEESAIVTVTPTTVLTKTPTPTPIAKASEILRESGAEDNNIVSTPVPKETATPTPEPTPTATTTPAPTEKETTTEESAEPLTPTPVPNEEALLDDTIPEIKSTLRGPLRGPAADTTWQDDWYYDLSGDSIVLRQYKGHTVTNLVIPASATISGVTYNTVKLVANSSGMFSGHTELQSIDFRNVDSSEVTNMNSMFSRCTGLNSLDLSMLDTSNVTDMGFMFYRCEALTNLTLGGSFDTGSVTNMWYMFNTCEALSSLDVTGFNTSSVTNMEEMFSGCLALTSLDLSSFDMSSATRVGDWLSGASGITVIKTPINLSAYAGTPFDIHSGRLTYMEEGVTPIVKYTLLPQNLSASKTLVRYYYPKSITVDPTSKSIAVNEEFTITPTILPATTTEPDVTWTSDKPSVVTVDSNGKVKGISAGTATITAKTVNDIEATCTVTVTNADIPVTSITVEPTSKSIVVNDEFTIIPTVLPSDATDKSVTWSTNKASVATVDSNGKVKGLAVGTATITAKTSNNLTATCEVTVTNAIKPVTSIAVEPTSKSIAVDEEFTIVPTVLPTDATDKNVTWSSDKPGIATVDASGKVKGIAVGTATITAKTSNNLTATCQVTVSAAPSPSYSLRVVDNRTSPSHPEMVTASVTNLSGNRFLIINDSDGNTIRPWIKADSTLKYDSIVYYDLRLTDSGSGGSDKTDFGECTFRLALPSDMNNTSGKVTIVTLKDGKIDKSLAYSVGKVNGVRCITTTTPHFTEFAILYKKPSEKKDDSDNHSDNSSASSNTSNTTNVYQNYYGTPALANPTNINRVLDTIPKTGDFRDEVKDRKRR